SIPQLRQLSPGKMLQTLRSLRADHLFLPVEDETSTAILPVLRGIAALTTARRIEVVHPDLQRETVFRWQAGSFVTSVAIASMAAIAAAKSCELEMKHLMREPRTSPRPVSEGSVLYLNANLWFGIKAGGSVGHIAGVANGLGRQGHPVDYAALSPCL